jgi:resuscitation-promoting factor RpfB
LLGRESQTSCNDRRKALATIVLACFAAAPLFVPVRVGAAPGPVAAERPAAPAFSIVSFVHNGSDASIETTARNVADFLVEQGIAPTPNDFVSLDPTTPIADGLKLEYRSAVPATLIVGGASQSIRTSAPDVKSLLASLDVDLGPLDIVTPSLNSNIDSGSTIRVQRVRTWTEHAREAIAPTTEQRLDLALKPNTQRILRRGYPGVRESTVRVVEIDGLPQRTVLSQRVVRKAQPRIVGISLEEYSRLSSLAQRGFEETLKMTGAALRMIATAYTSGCSGCSGYTALGARAGHGIVAVDPRVIPLGTRLYIPGYGPAIAGDTGGAIHGNRIDLGFDSYADAMRFGRRVVQVFVLH